MKTIDDVIEQCEEIANASKQHTLHMTHFSQSYDEWAEEWTQIAEWLKELKAYKEQSGDAISRQAVDDAIYDYSRSCNVDYSQIMEYIEKIPSVTPQPRTGRWIPIGYDGYADGNPVYDWWECSECGWEHTGDEESLTAFCPNCGAKMEVAE